jgi:hypothetical protein
MAKPGRRDQALRALARRRGPVDPDAHRIAQEVYEACVALKPGAADDPLPLAVRGPLFALNVRALEVIRARFPDVGASEEEAMDVVAYLTEGWCAMMLGFERGHFEEWRSRQDGSRGTVARPG